MNGHARETEDNDFDRTAHRLYGNINIDTTTATCLHAMYFVRQRGSVPIRIMSTYIFALFC